MGARPSKRSQTALNPKDRFVLTPQSYWHYSGDGVTGGTIENDNTMSILSEKRIRSLHAENPPVTLASNTPYDGSLKENQSASGICPTSVRPVNLLNRVHPDTLIAI